MTLPAPTLPKGVTVIPLGEREIYLVGTAHVSKESVEDVAQTVAAVDPDAICVELCEARHRAMTDRDNWKRMNIFKVVREKKSLFLLTQLIMASFYRRMGEKMDVQPGAEMMEGVRLAGVRGAALVLADRSIEITLKRVWGFLNLWSRIKMAGQLLMSLFVDEKIDTAMVEAMKESDQLGHLMEEFATEFPEVKRRLIDERDIYLAQKIRQAPGKRVVAVVGAGHVPGIKEYIHREIPLEPLMEVPPPSVLPSILKWAIPLLIVGLIVAGGIQGGATRSVEAIYIWVLVNGILAAMGAALALAHPLSILTAFVAAPIASLNPMIATGWVSGLVQAGVKKPTVADLEDLPNATASFRGFWQNPVSRILLVVALSNLGSTLGTFIAGGWIAARTF